MRRHELNTLLLTIESDYQMKKALGQIQFERDVIWLHDLVRVAVGTGLRRKELVQLRWIDVDLTNGFVEVRSYTDRATGKKRRTKRRKDRSVPIFPDVRVTLEAMQQRRINENPYAPVFANRSGKAMYGPYITKTFGVYRDLAGLDPDYDVHTLRHTFASWLRLRGVGLDRIREWMGHETLEQTMAYAHIVPQEIAAEGAVAFPVID